MQSYREYIENTFKPKPTRINIWRILVYSILTLAFFNALLNLSAIIFPGDATGIAYTEDISNYGVNFVFVMGVLLFPIFEELAFSFFLGKRKYQIVISLSLLLGVLITVINFAVFKEIQHSVYWFFVVWIGSSLFAMLWVALPVIGKESFAENIYGVIKYEMQPFGYFTVISFAAFHIYFIFITTNSIAIIPSSFLFGFYLAFRFIVNQIRLSQGFLFAVGFHSVYNLWMFWPILFPEIGN